MILIGLIFASGFRKKASYFSPSSSLVNFINLSVVSNLKDFEERWMLGSAAHPAALMHSWYWVSSGHQYCGVDMKKATSLRGHDTS